MRKAFRSEVIEGAFQVGRHVGIGVFVDRQRSRRMLDEHMQQANFDRSQFRQCFKDAIGDELKAAWKLRQAIII